MTDFNDEQNGTNENQVVEGQENSEQNENETQETQEAKTFTQEELDNIISERIAEVKNQSASEIAALRSQAEEVIANLSRAAASQNQRQEVIEEDETPPIPLAQMTPNQRLLWESNYPNRIAMKRMLDSAKKELGQSVAPMIQEQTVKNFFASRANVPDSIKKATQDIFQEAVRNGNRAPAEQIVVAAYTRALAVYAENTLFKGNGQTTQPAAKPKVVVKAPNGSADLGGGTRPITGKIGGSKSGSGKSYKEIMADLIAEGKMPDNGAGGNFG